MTVRLLNGHTISEGSRDDDGHRTFTVSRLVEAEIVPGAVPGPAEVMACPGLPTMGSSYLVDNDFDLWAFCYPHLKVTPFGAKRGHPVQFWEVEQKFSTKPLKRCQDTTIENPLLEPMKVSGSFQKYTKEANKSYLGRHFKSSSHETIKGAGAEFDRNRPTVRIEQNVAVLDLHIFSQMIDCVNDEPLWGLAKRCIKLSQPAWSRSLWGTCNFYYTRIFDFDIDYNTFDRKVPDEGTKVLHGHWRFGKKHKGVDEFKLEFMGETTPGLDNSCSASDVQSALIALTTIGSGNVSCTGGPLPDTPIQIEFINALANLNVDLITVDNRNLHSLERTQFGSVSSNEIQLLSAITNAWILDDIDGSPPDPDNPAHFDRYKDRNGENARVLLNGYGLPAETAVLTGTGTGTVVGTGSGTGTGTGKFSREAAEVLLDYYEEANFLLLGIPTSF